MIDSDDDDYDETSRNVAKLPNEATKGNTKLVTVTAKEHILSLMGETATILTKTFSYLVVPLLHSYRNDFNWIVRNHAKILRLPDHVAH